MSTSSGTATKRKVTYRSTALFLQRPQKSFSIPSILKETLLLTKNRGHLFSATHILNACCWSCIPTGGKLGALSQRGLPHAPKEKLMRNPDDQNTNTCETELEADVEEFSAKIRPRASQSVTLSIPVEALAQLEKVAIRRDMSVQGLLKFYIGQGLREDAARLFSENVLETTAQVLARHIASEEERSAILLEIKRGGAA